jgi:hypothetical protein
VKLGDAERSVSDLDSALDFADAVVALAGAFLFARFSVFFDFFAAISNLQDDRRYDREGFESRRSLWRTLPTLAAGGRDDPVRPQARRYLLLVFLRPWLAAIGSPRFCSRSLLPGIAAHTLIDVHDYLYEWQLVGKYDLRPLRDTGVDAKFMAQIVTGVVASVLTVIGMRKLWKSARERVT